LNTPADTASELKSFIRQHSPVRPGIDGDEHNHARPKGAEAPTKLCIGVDKDWRDRRLVGRRVVATKNREMLVFLG
jgi:hypothetical protein